MNGFLDTNPVLRYLLWDVEDQARAVKRLLEEGGVRFVLPDLIMAELVFVLQKIYQVPRKKIAEMLLDFISLEAVESNRLVLREALGLYAAGRLDFADTYLAAVARQENTSVISFDRDFKKIPGLRWQEP